MLGLLSGGAGLVGRLRWRGQGGALVAAILEVGGGGIFLFAGWELPCPAFPDDAGAEPFGWATRFLGNSSFLFVGLGNPYKLRGEPDKASMDCQGSRRAFFGFRTMLGLGESAKGEGKKRTKGKMALVSSLEDLSRLSGGCFCNAAPKVEKQRFIQGDAEGCLGKKAAFSKP